MLFKPELCQAILEGRKTQTRRLARGWRDWWGYNENGDICCVRLGGHSRMTWQVGNTYAIQPGRGKKAIGRTPPLVKVRRERLQDISCGGYMYRSDVQQEGCPFVNDPKQMGLDEIGWFIGLWDSIHTEKGTRWQDNPEVWVLEFSLKTLRARTRRRSQ